MKRMPSKRRPTVLHMCCTCKHCRPGYVIVSEMHTAGSGAAAVVHEPVLQAGVLRFCAPQLELRAC